MKKFTLFAVAALAALATQAQLPYKIIVGEATTTPERGKTYLLRTHTQSAGAKYLVASNGAKQMSPLVTSGDDAKKFVWTITANGDNWSLQNLDTQRYLNISGTANNGSVVMQDDPAEVAISVSDDGTHTGLKNPAADQWIDAGWNGSGNASTWGGGVAGSRIIDVVEAIEMTELMQNYEALLPQAQAAYKAVKYMGPNLITEASQLSSPYSDSDEGQDMNALIDGNTSTYWHSSWHDGDQESGIHYLEIALPEETLGDIQLSLTRRVADNDHLTKALIVGVNGEETDTIATILLPYGNNTETVKAYFTLTQAYGAIRVVELETNRNRGYWHASEIQLNKVEFNRSLVPTEAAALKAVLDEAPAIKDVTEDYFAQLTAAYEAYNAALAAIPTDFTIVVNGYENGGVAYGDNTYPAGTVQMPMNLTLADIAAAEVEGYEATIGMEGHTITVNYFDRFAPVFGENLLVCRGAEKADGVEPVSEAGDNSHWYMMTQTRDGFGAMYDTGAGLDRKLLTAIGDSLAVEEAAPYIVRFIATDLEGVYKVQFGTGSFVQKTLSAGNPSGAGTYFVYNISDEATHIGWNLTNDGTTYGSRCDTNAPGNGLSFWGNGKITDLNGNNDWSIYPVEFIPSIPTAIADVERTEQAPAQIYDLLGRQKATLGKGINIIRGKKVVVK